MKILHIDHHALFREGLHHVLRQLPGGVSEILEAESFPDGLKLAGQRADLNLMLLELDSPDSGGAIAVRLLRQCRPYIPVMVVSGAQDRRIINKALGYGASGFVSKSSTGTVLLDALKVVLSGGIHIPPLVQKPCSKRSAKRGQNSNECNLTARQTHILSYLTAGLSNKEIAETINLAEGTVKAHVAAIYQSLCVSNRMEAVRVARQLGLTDKSHPVPFRSLNDQAGC
ncbi:MAG: response regulator transcription factor [Gallionella sp.]|nr:response regulator transcription factor [Gallionella sp.]